MALDSSCCRLLQRLFLRIDSPLLILISQQQTAAQQQRQKQQQQKLQPVPSVDQQELLALATLRALQLDPKLGLTWRGTLWFRLLNHQLPVLRWAAVCGVSLMLGLSDAVQQQLMSKVLTDEQLVSAIMRYECLVALVAVTLQLLDPGERCMARNRGSWGNRHCNGPM